MHNAQEIGRGWAEGVSAPQHWWTGQSENAVGSLLWASLPRWCLDAQQESLLDQAPVSTPSELASSGTSLASSGTKCTYCTRARKYASLVCLKASALMWIISWRVVSRVHKARFRKHHRANDAGALTPNKLCPIAMPSVVGGRALGKDAGDTYWEER